MIAHQSGENEQAIELIEKALSIKPDFAEAHSNLGNALKALGRLDDAVERFEKSLSLKPNFVDAHSNLGLAFHIQGKVEQAIESYKKALNIKRDNAEVHSNLGNAYRELGEIDEAIRHHQRAISLNPENEILWASFAQALENISFGSVEERLFEDLLCLLNSPSVRVSRVMQPIISALCCDTDFSRLLEKVGIDKGKGEADYRGVAQQFSEFPLFLRIMQLSPLQDIEIERVLTHLRSTLLQEAVSGNTVEAGLPFSASLALQCFTNEYVFSETDEEKVALEDLQKEIERRLQKEEDISPTLIAALGSYRPLYKFSWARELCNREWTDDIKEVLTRQVSEPLEEQSLRSQIPSLTSIHNTVSQLVQEQYEENPYPRWIKTGLTENGKTVEAILAGGLFFDLGDYVSPEAPEILIAGCGTGQHALTTASRFLNSRVLAVDLSLSSLSYALRKSKELGFSNIEYAQADIMELGALGRQFDVIESVGVLHHLEDPLAGWRVLLDLLRPGGLMKVGLYSERARQDVTAGRSMITEKGYTTSPEDIRRCRQDIISMSEEGDQELLGTISKSTDFYSTSMCRDLLFHAQEHRFTLLQIEEALKALSLRFLGFEMRDDRLLTAFKKTNPGREALTSLPLWHEFEQGNPDTLIGMYQFWCRKI